MIHKLSDVQSVQIGLNTNIWQFCVVLPDAIICGVTIGENAMVGAGSVVTKDVAPNELVYGNPAVHERWIDEPCCKY